MMTLAPNEQPVSGGYRNSGDILPIAELNGAKSLVTKRPALPRSAARALKAIRRLYVAPWVPGTSPGKTEEKSFQ